MLASVNFNSGTGALVVVGNAIADTISLTDSADHQSFTVDINNNASLQQTFNYSDVTSVRVVAGDGDDFVFNDLLIDTEIFGQNGNDILNGGADNDFIWGAAGDDTIRGNAGSDRLNGGFGNDLIFGDEGRDIIRGDGGDDTLHGGDGDDDLFGLGGTDTIFGDAGADLLDAGGDVAADVLTGGSGLDRFVVLGNIGSTSVDLITDLEASETINGDTNDAGDPPTPAATASIGDLVFEDTDGDGAFDSGEAGISNVTLTLFSGTEVIATQTTDASGQYTFENLPSGNYRVELTTDLTYDYDLTTATSVDVTLAEGQINNSVDFGAKALPPGTGVIGDLVFEDFNENQVFDAGEPGIENVIVLLLRGETEIARQETDSSGGYSFEQIRPGDYRVELVPSSHSGLTITTASFYEFPISSGQQISNADFGLNPIGSSQLQSELTAAFSTEISELDLVSFASVFGGVQDVGTGVKLVDLGTRSVFFVVDGVSISGPTYKYGGDIPSGLNYQAVEALAAMGLASGGVIQVVSQSAVPNGLDSSSIYQPTIFADTIVSRSNSGTIEILGTVEYEGVEPEPQLHITEFEIDPFVQPTAADSQDAPLNAARQSFGTLGPAALTALNGLLGSELSQDSVDFLQQPVEPPSNAPEPTDRWSEQGVKEIIGNNPLLNQEVTVIRFTSALDQWEDSSGDRTWEVIKGLRGNTVKPAKEIRIRGDLSNEQAAATLIHELEHLSRQPATTREEYLVEEIDVRVATEEWAILNGKPETGRGYRNSDGTVNRTLIESKLRNSDHYNPDNRTRTNRAYVGESTVFQVTPSLP